MTVFRFLGTPLIDRFGRVAVLRVSGLATFVGVLVFVFSPSLATAWIGVLLWGCGAALGNPIAISAASDDPDHAGPRVAVVTSFSTLSSLAAPPLLGLLASQVGARNAMLVVAMVAVVSFSVAAQARRRAPQAPEPALAVD
jgi:MFS family permease